MVSSSGSGNMMLDCLAQVSEMAGRSNDLIEAIRQMHQLIMPMFEHDVLLFSLYHREEGEVEYIYSIVENREVNIKNFRYRFLVQGSRIAPMVEGKQAILVDNWRRDEEHDYQVISVGNNPPRVHTLLDVPLLVGDEVVGGLHLQSFRLKAWGEDMVKLASVVAEIIAGATIYQQAMAYINIGNSYSQCIHQVSQVCSSPAPIGQIVEQVTEICSRFFDALSGVLFNEGDTLRLASIFHPDPVVLAIQTEFLHRNLAALRDSGGLSTRLTGKPILVNNIDPTSLSATGVARGGTTAYMAAPLRGYNRILGQMSVALFNPDRRLRDYDLALLESICAYLSLAIEGAAAREGSSS